MLNNGRHNGVSVNPKVSVCMPTYNYARYLPEAIESVLKQNYTDYEFIIIDDCSTDNSVEVIRSYANKDRRISLIINECNLGQAKNLNKCLNHAQGEYIKFVFSDDFLISDRALERLVSVLDQDPDIALVTTARYFVDEKSNILETLSEYEASIVCIGTEVVRDCLLEQKNKIGEPTSVLFRKKHAKRGFNENYNQNVDMEMWFHILEQGKFAYIHEPLCSFRTHSNQQTKLNVEKGTHFADLFRIWNDYNQKPYVRFSLVRRAYAAYFPAFEIWKFYKKYHRITLHTAINKIHSQFGIAKFVVLFPVFRIYRTHMSIKRRVRKLMRPLIQS